MYPPGSVENGVFIGVVVCPSLHESQNERALATQGSSRNHDRPALVSHDTCVDEEPIPGGTGDPKVKVRLDLPLDRGELP